MQGKRLKYKRIEDIPFRLQKKIAAIALIKNYYLFESSGGHLHVVLDDENIEDGYVSSSLWNAIVNGDYFGEQIARLLLEFTEEEREEIIRNPKAIIDQVTRTH